jgi:serine/threonine protein kinase/tetratricopeptide (TPR) repeat protein
MTDERKPNSADPDVTADRSAPLPDDLTATALTPATAPLPPAVAAAPTGVAYGPGQILAGRFKIIRFVARGGMGEVYEAEDQELNERVAVKTARFEGAQSEHDIERFRREIQLARRVTHPNVCRTFDVFRHVVTPIGGGAPTEILLVSMELLGGETLDKRVRGARMSAAEALPIVEEMCAGLGAAHRVGVIHRDFKSSNVMLVPLTPAGNANALRTVITDFGLAHAESHPGMTLTRPGDIVGTPSYMAPEQIEGGAITAATDIYSLGIVIYEMLTGVLPFAADTPLATAMKRLKAPAPSPRLHVPDIDGKWEAVIARCLEREPEQRFASTDDIMKALRGESAVRSAPSAESASATVARSSSESVTGASDSAKWKKFWAAAVLVLLACGMLAVRYVMRQEQREKEAKEASATAPAARKSIAILGFKNLSGRADADSLGNVLEDSLWSQLDTGQVRFIPPSQVDEMKQNLALGDATNSLSTAQLESIHKYLGADVLVTGSYALAGAPQDPTIQWNIHLESASGGPSLGSVSESGKKSDLNGLVAHSGRLARQQLGITLSAAEEARLDSSLSSNADAMRYFSDAREKLRMFDVLAATKLLEKSIEADPQFAQAHSALAQAWDSLGFENKATEEAKKALDSASGLSTEARNVVTARYYAATRNWSKAIPQYASLWSEYRDEPEYGLQLAETQIRAGKPKDALTTLAQVRSQSPPAGIRAQLDLSEARAHEALGDYKEELSSATSAADTAQTLGSNLLLARSRILQCFAQVNLGDAAKAKPMCEEAKKINLAAGDQLGAARATNDIANAYYYAGNYAEAEPLYQEALGIAQSIGDKYDEAGALNNLGNIQSAKGDHAAAQKTYEQSIGVARERGELGDVALAQQNMAMDLFASGAAARGKEMLAASLKTARDIGDKNLVASILNNQCGIAISAGALADARKNCGESLNIRREGGDRANIGKTLATYGIVQMQQGDLDAASQSLMEAQGDLEAVNAKSDAAYNRITLAALSLEQGRADSAVKYATDAATELAAEKDASGESGARAALANALVASGNISGAREQADKAVTFAAQSGDRGAKWDAALASARVDARSGKTDAAIKSLAAIEKDAHAAGMVQIEFEARLALGQAQIAGGKSAAGKSTLRALAQDAKSRGFGLIARQATGGAAA